MTNLLLIPILSIILYQDIRYRMVYLWAFILLIILSFIHNYKSIGLYYTLYNFILGLLFILTQLFFVWIWFKIQKKTLKNSIGSGDLLFLLAMLVGFSFNTFILLYITSLLFSLIAYLLFIKKGNTIPLAGYMSFCWIIYILFYEIRFY